MHGRQMNLTKSAHTTLARRRRVALTMRNYGSSVSVSLYQTPIILTFVVETVVAIKCVGKDRWEYCLKWQDWAWDHNS